MKPLRLLIFLLPLILWACSGNAPSHPALIHAARLLDASPDSAAVADSLLLSVTPDSLSEGDRNFHDLLRVKADDKLFRQHRSDSIILTVVEYERKHQGRGLYPEALYYAGRVYSDLGDYPTATDYFQQAIDNTTDEHKNRALKSRILYHLLYCLNELALYKAAAETIPEAIRLNRIGGDSVRLANLYELCGTIEYNRHNFEASRKYLLNARKIYSAYNMADSLSVITQLAMIESENDNIEKAITILATTSIEPDSLSRPYIYAARSRIYLKGGMADSAYHYAMLLLNLDQFQNRHAAFSVLLNSALAEKIDPESRLMYVNLYAEELGSHYAHRDSVLAYHQQLTYNYNLHLRREEEAEIRNLWLGRVVTALVIVIMVVVITLLLVRNNKNKKIIRLLETIGTLRTMLGKAPDESLAQRRHKGRDASPHLPPKEKADRLEEEYRLLIRELSGKSREENVNTKILNPEFQGELRNIISDKAPVPPDSPFWEKLEQAVLSASPRFIEILDAIIPGLSVRDLRVCMLMRCRVRPSQIAAMLSISKQGMTSLRGRLRKKVRLADLSSEEFDRMVENL